MVSQMIGHYILEKKIGDSIIELCMIMHNNVGKLEVVF